MKTGVGRNPFRVETCVETFVSSSCPPDGGAFPPASRLRFPTGRSARTASVIGAPNARCCGNPGTLDAVTSSQSAQSELSCGAGSSVVCPARACDYCCLAAEVVLRRDHPFAWLAFSILDCFFFLPLLFFHRQAAPKHSIAKTALQQHCWQGQKCLDGYRMGQTQPFLYDARRDDSRFPTTTFDPKAVTRASWEPKQKKPKPKGPMVSFDLHPEYVCQAVIVFEN